VVEGTNMAGMVRRRGEGSRRCGCGCVSEYICNRVSGSGYPGEGGLGCPPSRWKKCSTYTTLPHSWTIPRSHEDVETSGRMGEDERMWIVWLGFSEVGGGLCV